MAFAVRSVFSSSAEGPAVRIDRLRRALCTAETATGLTGEVGVPLTLGIPRIDDVLGGGLSGSALHEIAAARETEIAAATGSHWRWPARAGHSASFGAQQRCCAPNGSTLAIEFAPKRDAIWIAEDLSLAENGAPYGPVLHEAGIVPERLITVQPRTDATCCGRWRKRCVATPSAW